MAAVVGVALDHFSEAQVCAEEALQDALAFLHEAHQEEVRQLREKVAQLSEDLRTVHTVALCARIDEPDLDAVRKEACLGVAAELSQGIFLDQADPPLRTTAPARPFVTAEKWELAAAAAKFEMQAAEGKGEGFTSSGSPNGSPHGSPKTTGLLTSGRKTADSEEAKLASRSFTTSTRDTNNKELKDSQRQTERLTKETSDKQKQKKAEQILKEAWKLKPASQRRVQKSNHRHASRAGEGDVFGTILYWVESSCFDTICELAIIANSILVGLDVEYPDTPWIEFSQYVCSLFFLIELLCRLRAYGLSWYTGEDYIWSFFDTLLVGFSIVDFLLSKRVGVTDLGSSSSNVSAGVKTIRMVRIARVVRTFRFFRELSLLALMIRDSLRSLMWALLMLLIIIYVFAILFTQTAKDYLRAESLDDARFGLIEGQFGSIPKTLYSLLQAMLGGVDWGVASDTLLSIHWALGALFFFYIFFTMLAFLNITTGVFVDNAVETARSQRDFLVERETELKEKYLREMRELFLEMDEDESGTVSLKEVKQYFEDPRVHSYFAALGLEAADTERLFTLLDNNETGDINVDEFLTGCLRLKGLARSIDMQHLLIDVETLVKEFKKLNKRASRWPLTVRRRDPRQGGSISSEALPGGKEQ